jgi:hypothetical protein
LWLIQECFWHIHLGTLHKKKCVLVHKVKCISQKKLRNKNCKLRNNLLILFTCKDIIKIYENFLRTKMKISELLLYISSYEQGVTCIVVRFSLVMTQSKVGLQDERVNSQVNELTIIYWYFFLSKKASFWRI